MSLRPLLRTHTNSILVFLAVVFLAIIISYFSWGIGYLVDQVSDANTDQINVGQTAGFNFTAAAALDYRGTLQQ